MAIQHYRSVPSTGKCEMTIEEFKRWLMSFDTDKDGRISRGELQAAIKATGGWFARWKSWSGLKKADTDHSGFIDAGEIENLQEFAEKNLGVRIVLKKVDSHLRI